MLPLAEEIKRRAQSVSLTLEERSRYSRHLLLPEVGEHGQRALKAAKVLIIGTGGLGSPVGLYLAAAGVGRIGLIDFDTVDDTNLQRQILYVESDKGSAKAEVAAKKLSALNSHIVVEPIQERLDVGNIQNIFSRYDVIVDGTDNFSTRYLVNDAAVFSQKPVVYGSIFRFDGQASLFYAPYGPCYRCLFPKPPPPGHVPNCAEGGVLGVLPGVIGVIQATEALKLITGIGESLMGRLLTYDAMSMRHTEFSFKKDSDCAVCGQHPTITTVNASAFACSVGGDESRTVDVPELTVAEFEALRESREPFILIDVRTEQELSICAIPEAVHIPLAELDQRSHEIVRDRPIVVLCKAGQRSLTAARKLTDFGYRDVSSLKGGIIAWIEETGADLAKY